MTMRTLLLAVVVVAAGDIFTLYVYKPEFEGGQRSLHTVTVE